MTRTPFFATSQAIPGGFGTLAEERPMAIPYGDEFLTGSLSVVPQSDAVVLIANGGGAGRHSPAMRELTAALRREGFTTAIVDLLLAEEAGDAERAAWTKLRVTELARRVSSARSWADGRPELQGLPLVLFGQGAGAAAVLLSAGARPSGVAAVIARDGMPDSVGLALESVQAPVLLLVETTSAGLSPCLRAHARLTCDKVIAVTSALLTPDACARTAARWIRSRLPQPAAASLRSLVSGDRFVELVG